MTGALPAAPMRCAIVIPVLNEAEALPRVLAEIPTGIRVVVADNGSTDGSDRLAREAGAEVVRWPHRGYGGAVLAGLRHLAAQDAPDIVVILDGDHSAYLEDLEALVAPIRRGEADLVIGERLTRAEPGSITPQQRYGNALAVGLIAAVTGRRYRDMGPFRAARFPALLALGMEDLTWGWNVEMQMKAVQAGLRVLEVPVGHRPRIGTSKISGTVSGVARAGAKILWAVWRYR